MTGKETLTRLLQRRFAVANLLAVGPLKNCGSPGRPFWTAFPAGRVRPATLGSSSD